MKYCQESGLLSISMLKVIQIFIVLYFHMFDKTTTRRIKKKNKDGHVHVERKKEKEKEEWIFKNTIMLVNFIYKWVCFIGFIAAMKIVKRMLGNDNFDSVSSSPLTCWYLTFATIDVQNIQFHKKDTLSPKMRAQILHQSVPMKRKKKKTKIW